METMIIRGLGGKNIDSGGWYLLLALRKSRVVLRVMSGMRGFGMPILKR